jgi:hypothetical protein
LVTEAEAEAKAAASAKNTPFFRRLPPGAAFYSGAIAFLFGAFAMDIRYARALRDASAAWAQNRAIDALTLQDLRRRAPQPAAPETKVASTPSPAQMAVLQPQLAAYGNLGTRLNLFA